jgi:hypothetical protein
MAGRGAVLDQTVPNWESQLWSFVGSGNGLVCPIYHRCYIRARGGWCPNKYLDKLNNMLDTQDYRPEDFDFLKYDTYCLMFRMLEKLAQKFLRTGGVYTPPVPDDLITVLNLPGKVEVRVVPLRACHGAVWQLRDGWIIHLSSNETSAMKRFVLFHEAFHVLAHSNTSPIFNKMNGIRGAFNEMLADFFSCSLLLPKKWAQAKLMEVRDIHRLATIFDIPEPFVVIRLKRMGLIN